MNNTVTLPSVLMRIPLSMVHPNPEQPRQHFDPEKLEELAQSIREHGVIEPISVEEAGNEYILHDGERRTRAARLAGLTDIPAVIVPPLNGTGPQMRLERAIVANVQRVNMTPVEEARAYKRLRDEFGLNIVQIVTRTGRNRTLVTQRLQLTELEPEIQALIERGFLPSYVDAVEALLTLPAGGLRVKFAHVLAQRKPSVGVIVSACHKFLAGSTAPAPKPHESPALGLAQKKVHAEIKRPEWDALKQLGTLPPWSLVREQAKSTCDSCALRSVASDATCHECPLVDHLRRLMQAANVH